MRRRVSSIGVAVAAVSLLVGVGVSVAAGHGHHHKAVKHSKPRFELLRCLSYPTTTPPAGQANVDQPPASGTSYGPVGCSTPGFGGGTIELTFTVPDSGDMIGKFTEYFDAGTVRGTFDLSPGDGQPIGADTFASQSFEGQATVTGGTGVYDAIKSKNNKGTMTCNSPDSVHNTCTQNIGVLIPPPASSSTTGTTGPSGAHR